jgi:hypothetical protein
MKYDVIPNNASGSNAPRLTETKVEDGIDKKNLYRTDMQTQEQFPDHVGTPNPAWNYLKQESTHGDYGVHPQQFINKYKVCEISVRGGLQGRHVQPSAQSFGNWRTLGGKKWVDDNVLLMTDSQTITGSYSHSIGIAWDGMKPGFLNQVEGALEMARLMTGNADVPQGGKFISKYSKVPVYNGTEPNNLGNIKFNFEFGMAGIYSGEHEVVRPIFALAAQFTPSFVQGFENYLRGPAPTDAVYFAAMASYLVKNGDNMVKKVKDAVTSVDLTGEVDDAVSGLVGAATKIQQDIYTAIDEGIKAAAGNKDNPLKTIFIRYGRFVTGPYFVKDVSWELNFEEVDEYGFPYKGSITLGGLKSVWVATAGDFLSSFDPGA